MSNSGNAGKGVGRRDTLKLAGAAAALGAGLGMVLKAKDALADTAVAPGAVAKPLPGGPVVASKMIIGPEVQVKIDTLAKLPLAKGNVQMKLHTAAGQFLYAANMPDEIARVVMGAPAGQVQVKWYRGEAASPTVASVPFSEGLIQLVPSNGQR